ncbi:MAG TPA: flavodoxin domain-containing protein [Polyangiaceae bacterium]
MASILVVYATKEGQTEKIARRITDTLRHEGHTVDLVDTDHPRVVPEHGRFQAVFVGAPIHAGGYPRSVLRFVRTHHALLERVPSAFFSVGLAVASRTSDGRAQTLPLVEKFVEQTGWRPRRVELLAGALLYSKYNFLVRFVMRRISAKEGGDTDTTRDYEYTDWQAVDRFALDFVRESTGERSVDPATTVHAASA